MDVHQSLSSSKFRPRSIDFSLAKENLSPCVPGSPTCTRTPSKIRPPLRSNSVVANQPESLVGLISTSCSSATTLASQEGFGSIDSEIGSIEKEISRLSSRLEYLRLEKAKRIAVRSAAALKWGRFVPAKFMDPSPNPRKIDESVSAKKTMPRNRRLTMAPSEIARDLTAAAAAAPLGRRGISLGPAEIYSAAKSKNSANRKEITPVYRSQIIRKPSLRKLQEVDELEAIEEQGNNPQAADSTKAVTTLRASKNKSVKKEDEFISSVQPKKLFTDGDKSVTAKKPLQLRAVASRYKCSNAGSTNRDSATPNGARKRSLPDDMESKTFYRKRISLSRKYGE